MIIKRRSMTRSEIREIPGVYDILKSNQHIGLITFMYSRVRESIIHRNHIKIVVNVSGHKTHISYYNLHLRI